MNDPTIIQAARTLGNQLLALHPNDIDAAISDAFRRTTARPINPAELATLRSVYEAQLGELPATELRVPAMGGTAEQVFALSQVIRVVFNLNETISLE